jgi:nitrous oxidase accessory protein
LPESQVGDGIHFFHSRRVLATGNRIRQVRDGMYFAYSDSVTVVGNEVSRVRFGLHYMFSHQNRFEHNRFTENAAGAVLMNSNGLIVRNNVFAWNRGSRSYGLVLQTTTGARVENNSFVGNGIGVFLDNAIRARVTGNLVASNWLALQLFPNSEATVLTGNTIADNFFDAAGGWVEGAYLLCENGVGNYWSGAGATGFDLEGDGILDAPYTPGSPLAELAREREQLRLFTSSPAAQVINWAERTFPVFDIPQPVDSCPLARPATQVATLSEPPVLPGSSDQFLFRGGLIAATVVAGAGLVGWRTPGKAA